MVQRFWDERHQELSQFVSQQIQNMQEHAPREIEGLDKNLFVSEEYASVVRKNFDEVAENLKALSLQLEKLQFYYTNL